ncbi:MAG: hypothetical protein ABL995_10080 [Bryobacteraceae bacterium]
MFFRNPKVKELSFDDRLSNLSQFGFSVSRQSGGAKVTREGFGAVVEDMGGGNVAIGKAGLLAGDEVATLVHGGFQMFLRTPSGKEFPAQANQLTALHAFDEDLREGLGLISLYNVSLGTTADSHMYDRVKERDERHHARPWER